MVTARRQFLDSNQQSSFVPESPLSEGLSGENGRRFPRSSEPSSYHDRFQADRKTRKRGGGNGLETVRDWNAVMLQAIEITKVPPPLAARNMAIVSCAVYDAVSSVLRLGDAYYAKVKAPKWASADAAAASAAYETLVNLFPTQKALFDNALAVSLGEIRDGRGENKGLEIGKAVAQIVLAARLNDGASAAVPYTQGSGIGVWQSETNTTPVLPQWPGVKPFALQTGAQFRSLVNAPAPTSAQFVQELEETRSLGAKNSTTRTADQTQIALFWADGGGTYTPPGHWNRIASDVARQKGTTLFEDAKLFAALNIAVADAGICAWDAKYTYNQWRPFNAIRTTEAGVPWTPDPNWKPLIATPNFPDCVSGHSTFSAAAGEVLETFFGENTNFTATAHTNSAVPNVARSYGSFDQAVSEAGRSRIYGGIHWESSNVEGQEIGRAIGDLVCQRMLSKV